MWVELNSWVGWTMGGAEGLMVWSHWLNGNPDGAYIYASRSLSDNYVTRPSI